MASAQCNRRILIVDDNQAIHADFRKILAAPAASSAALAELEAMLFSTDHVAKPSEFELDSAYQGREALERVKSAKAAGQPYAVAFIDMRMPPGWDGLETIEHVWRADPLLQVVICSAFSDHSWEELRRRLGESDALLIIKKPFDPIEVVQTAHALTTKWTLAQRTRAHVENLESAVRTHTVELGCLATRLHEIETPIQQVGDSLSFVRDATLELVRMATAMRAAAAERNPPESSATTVRTEPGAVTEAADLGYLAERIPQALDRLQDGVARVAMIVGAMTELVHPGQREMVVAGLDRGLENALHVTASASGRAVDLADDLGDPG